MIRIDLHRHLGGSIKAATVHEILQKQQNSTQSLEDITKQMMFSLNEKLDFHNFLSKFKILDDIHWDEWAISRVVEQVCWDVAKDKIDYVELKFSVDKYAKSTGWAYKHVVKFIHDVIQSECSKWGCEIALILSLKYESDRTRQREISKLVDSEASAFISGIDLVGDEAFFDANFYQPIFNEWRKAGKGLIAHVGESQSAENVRAAIERLGVHRIAHGFRAIDHPDIISLVKDRNICFDIALTSNLYTGVVNSIIEHPVGRLISSGVPVTIGTDDPTILDTTLDKEYELLISTFGLSDELVMDVMNNSLKYSFRELFR